MQSRFGPWLRRPLRQSIRPLGHVQQPGPCRSCATSTSFAPARPRANRPASIHYQTLYSLLPVPYGLKMNGTHWCPRAHGLCERGTGEAAVRNPDSTPTNPQQYQMRSQSPKWSPQTTDTSVMEMTDLFSMPINASTGASTCKSRRVESLDTIRAWVASTASTATGSRGPVLRHQAPKLLPPPPLRHSSCSAQRLHPFTALMACVSIPTSATRALFRSYKRLAPQ